VDLEPFRKAYGRVAVEHREWPVDAEEFARFAARGAEPVGAAALVWDRAGKVLLVREQSASGKGGAWATPGGFAEPGESPEACVRREAREEAGVDLRITGLTKVIVCHVADGGRVLPFTFFQFEAEHAGGTPRSGEGIADVAWFDRLPDDMHFREDYADVWRRRRPARPDSNGAGQL